MLPNCICVSTSHFRSLFSRDWGIPSPYHSPPAPTELRVPHPHSLPPTPTEPRVPPPSPPPTPTERGVHPGPPTSPNEPPPLLPHPTHPGVPPPPSSPTCKGTKTLSKRKEGGKERMICSPHKFNAETLRHLTHCKMSLMQITDSKVTINLKW